jgi:hypothetical protein
VRGLDFGLSLVGRLWDQLLGAGHRSIGPVTFYRFETAMHGAVNISTKRWGVICFAWPRLGGYRDWPAYFYLSPNATPWASTLMLGNDGHMTREERRLVAVRRALWGHGYDAERMDPQLLGKAIEAVEYRDAGSLNSFARMFYERAEWIKDGAA